MKFDGPHIEEWSVSWWFTLSNSMVLKRRQTQTGLVLRWVILALTPHTHLLSFWQSNWLTVALLSGRWWKVRNLCCCRPTSWLTSSPAMSSTCAARSKFSTRWWPGLNTASKNADLSYRRFDAKKKYTTTTCCCYCQYDLNLNLQQCFHLSAMTQSTLEMTWI